MIHNQSPDLVLLDINIQGSRDGIEIAEILEAKQEIPYLFITAFSDPGTLNRAQAVRPLAYIVKPFREEDLKASIAIGMSNFRRQKEDGALTIGMINEQALSPLTDKEFEILIAMSKGLTNSHIANNFDLSSNTVKWHTQNIYKKLGVKNRTAAAQFLVNL